MTTQSKPYPRVEFLINSFADWLKRRRELNEMRQMDRSDFDRIAGDLRVTPDDLNELVRQGPHSADELPKMLKALGINEASLARAQPLVLRDMERVCAMCNHKRQCDRDLIAGTAAEHYEDYCLNAPTINELGRTEAAK
jgi:transcriptional regulator with XRE-family HTH domain